MTLLEPADGRLAPEVLLSSLLLSSLLRWPPACLLLSLSLKNFDRKGNLTLSMGQRWRREQESGGCILTFCRKTAVVVQPALFLKS